MQVLFEPLGQIVRDATNEVLIFAQAHGGDVGEFVVFVHEAGVGVGGIAAAGEDVEDGDGVARSKPVGDGD